MLYCIDYLEKYKTKHGVNITTLYDLFISKETLLKTKVNERKPLVVELYSTYFMAMIKKRIEEIK